ncbi:uncharacterized protein LOC118192717 isoform X2 [Stegodyphus dumicola]|uniref:uncharacterized protein LOC118192717 isoform X2 n=1 Tax=Stegodyphus dumicola TaxID=202533 RepID=UPI0015AA3865|nr:uncharacterized protein LOC118192717 isoform X2 [Stegodyphus dumicola]
MTSASWYLIATLPEKGVLTEESENNNPKWTLSTMEKYMRDESESSVALGLVSQSPLPNSKRRQPQAAYHHQQHIPSYSTQNGDVVESGGEESSPSWASSSNTPSYASGGVSFDFNSKPEDGCDKVAPTITTTSCTPNSTPENAKNRKQSGAVPFSLSTDLLAALNSDSELSAVKPRKSRKDSDSSLKSQSKGSSAAGSRNGTPTKTSKLSKLLRRTHSAGCSKDVPAHSQFMKEKAVSVFFFFFFL